MSPSPAVQFLAESNHDASHQVPDSVLDGVLGQLVWALGLTSKQARLRVSREMVMLAFLGVLAQSHLYACSASPYHHLTPASGIPSSWVQASNLTSPPKKCLTPLPSREGSILALLVQGRLSKAAGSVHHQMGPEHAREGPLRCTCHVEHW